MSKKLYVIPSRWKKRTERPNVGGVSIRRRNRAPSRNGCVVNAQMNKVGNKRVPLPPNRTYSLGMYRGMGNLLTSNEGVVGSATLECQLIAWLLAS